MQETITSINTLGLTLGFIGAFVLILITPQMLQINADGSVSMGASDGNQEAWRKKNRRLRWLQRYVMPVCYLFIAFGFLAQLFATWLPSICGSQF